MRRKWFAVGTVVIVVAVGTFLWVWGSRYAPPAIPANNGYDDLLRAAGLVQPLSVNWRDLSEQELAEYVADNAAALALMDEALERDSVVPLPWEHESEVEPLQLQLDRLALVSRLGTAVLCAAKDAAARGDAELSAQHCVKLIRLARSMRNGGLVIDVLKSYAYQSAAATELETLLPQLEGTACLQVAGELSGDREETEPVADLVQRDWEWNMNTHSLSHGAVLRFHASTLSQHLAPAVASAEKAQRQIELQMSILRARTAIRRFELAEGRLPENLDALAPKYLSPEELGQLANDRVHYQPTGDQYLLFTEAESDATRDPPAAEAR
ncbi:MAG: hypothetical protein AAF961_01555 [Planctomycetota bacterium]